MRKDRFIFYFLWKLVIYYSHYFSNSGEKVILNPLHCMWFHNFIILLKQIKSHLATLCTSLTRWRHRRRIFWYILVLSRIVWDIIDVALGEFWREIWQVNWFVLFKILKETFSRKTKSWSENIKISQGIIMPKLMCFFKNIYH